MELSILIVNYNTRELLQNCINSIFENTEDITYEVIVVDNNSTDGSEKMVLNMFPQVQLLCNQENMGFARANNQAYRQSKGKYLLFMNSDTLALNSPFEKMIDYMKDHPEVGIVGPKILDNKDQPTRSYMRLLDVKKLFFGSKHFKSFIDVEKHRIHFPLYYYDMIQEVPWLSGACMMVRRKVFREAGLFDERYFLFLEDMDLCLQVAKLGYRIIYFPKAEIIHLFGGSSEVDSKKLSRIHRDSMLLYFKKNFSRIHYWMAKAYLSLLR